MFNFHLNFNTLQPKACILSDRHEIASLNQKGKYIDPPLVTALIGKALHKV